MGLNNFSKKNFEINAYWWNILNDWNFLLTKENIILHIHFIEYGSKYKLSNKFFNILSSKLIVLSKFVIYSSKTCWSVKLKVVFVWNISELNRLGIPYGIYIYGYAQNEYAANIEANFVYDMIQKYNVKLYYPVFYDAEIRNYNGVNYTKNLYTKVINAFSNNLENKGIKTGVYGNLYMLTKGSLNDLSIRNKPIWVAQYYNKCQYDSDYIGWQYSSKGSIPGVNGRVDVNIFNY